MHKKYDDLRKEVEHLTFLEQAGVNPRIYVAAKLAQHSDFELPSRAADDLYAQALQRIARRKHYRPPDEAQNEILPFGLHAILKEPVGIPLEHVPSGILLTGGAGSGKSNCIFNLMHWLYRREVMLRFWDYKGEARRLPFFWPDAVVFNLRNAPWHILEPVGDPMAYYTGIIGDLRHEFELRPETYPLLWGILERIVRGMKPGDPFPSLEDFRRVVEHEARVQGRENLLTAARVLMTLCVLLGPQARARRVPDVSNRYKVIGWDFVGQDPVIFRLFLGFQFTRLILKAQEEGHSTRLRAVDIIDEGSVIFGSELARWGVTHISSAKRMASMARFTGTGLIVGAQNLSQIDSFLKQNCATLVVFRTPSVDDAVEASKMLGLEKNSVEELMRLERGHAYMRSIGWEQPVKIHVPAFVP